MSSSLKRSSIPGLNRVVRLFDFWTASNDRFPTLPARPWRRWRDLEGSLRVDFHRPECAISGRSPTVLRTCPIRLSAALPGRPRYAKSAPRATVPESSFQRFSSTRRAIFVPAIDRRESTRSGIPDRDCGPGGGEGLRKAATGAGGSRGAVAAAQGAVIRTISTRLSPHFEKCGGHKSVVNYLNISVRPRGSMTANQQLLKGAISTGIAALVF